jgi:hydroxymethylpyrimidine pyrophosphatase-like HAD family hydrolase
MKKCLIAFDCDGTLIHDGALAEHEIVPNERIRTLLIVLSSMKNTKIMVWSGGGEVWARDVVRYLGLQKYVDLYADKLLLGRGTDGKLQFGTDIKPDIAIDDIQDCELGLINLIVREK